MKLVRRAGIKASAIVTAFLVTLSGCYAGHTAVGPGGIASGDRREVVIGVGAEPTNLDFTTTAGAAIPQLLLNNVYETLVKVDQNGGIIPLLAESWTLSDDRTVYDFYLRQGVTFSNGQPFTAADVVASFKRTQTDWLNAISHSMDIIVSTEAISDYQVRVTLAQPSNEWLFRLGTAPGAIFPADITWDLRTEAIGTGPYRIIDVSPGNSITLAGREEYWGVKPGMDMVTIQYLLDTTAAVNALRAGDIDMLFNLTSGDQARALEDVAGVQVVAGTSTGDILWSFNNQREPFTDIRVRQALAHAVDRAAIMETVAAGYGTLVGAMVTPQDPYFEDLSEYYPYDPALARQLLTEAGQQNLSLSLDVPNLFYATQAAELIVSYLAQVGVTATINVLEFPAVWLDQVFTNHNFDTSIIMHSEPRDLLTVFGSPDYYVGYDNPLVMELATAADAMSEPEWIAEMQHVVQLITADCPGVVLYLAPTLIVADVNLTGLRPNGVTESMDLTELHWQ